MSSRSMLQVHQGLAAGFILCRFDLDKKISLVVCLAFDSDIVTCHIHSADDHNIDTDTAVLSLSFLWGACVS